MSRRRLIGFSLIVVGLLGVVAVFVVGPGFSPGRGRYVNSWSARRAVLSAFEQADTMELFTMSWPNESGREYKLGVISREKDGAVWQMILREARQAGPKLPHKASSPIRFRLLRRGHALCTGGVISGVNEIAIFLDSGKVAAVTGSAALGQVFGPYEEAASKAHKSAWKEYLQSHPDVQLRADAARSSVSNKPIASFPQVKRNLLKLFLECDYVNIWMPGKQSMGVNVQKEGRTAWTRMTAMVERAEKGWALTSDPKTITLLCERPQEPGKIYFLRYIAGVLGAEDASLGGNMVTLKVPPDFQKGICSLVDAAEKRERAEKRKGASAR